MEWISVKDKLPKHFKEVITWGKEIEFGIHEYNGDKWEDSMGWTPYDKITHWRELPDIPTI